MTSKGNEGTVSFSEVAQRLNETITGADTARTEGLMLLRRMQSAKTGALEREYRRLRSKLGASHPRVVEVAARIQANGMFIRDLDLAIVRSQTEAPAADPEGWIVHGLVLSEKLRGVPNLTVALFDERGTRIEEMGTSITDAKGAFKLRYVRPTLRTTEGQAQPTDETRLAADLKMAQREARASQGRGTGVFLHVFDNKNVRLHVDQQPLVPELGRVEYREVIIPGLDAPEGPSGKGRFLGNPRSGELHDLERLTTRCQVDEIPEGYRIYFDDERAAIAAGYDYCAYCFGRERSQR